MIFGPESSPTAVGFDEKLFQNIFLHDKFSGEKAELWALYDAPIQFHALNLLRNLRALWGIDLHVKIGPRSESNQSPRAIITTRNDGNFYLEGYAGNISDAIRGIVAMAPHPHSDKSRVLSQKHFVRIVVGLQKLGATQKIDRLLLAYSVASYLDPARFAGIIDMDQFLMLPTSTVKAGIANYHRPEQLLNTHLIYGFNFFELNGNVTFFTHGLGRFKMNDLVIQGEKLSTENYREALKLAHVYFLNGLANKGKQPKPVATKKMKLPEQVEAMVTKQLTRVNLKPG